MYLDRKGIARDGIGLASQFVGDGTQPAALAVEFSAERAIFENEAFRGVAHLFISLQVV
jgi:hypothetical protein